MEKGSRSGRRVPKRNLLSWWNNRKIRYKTKEKGKVVNLNMVLCEYSKGSDSVLVASRLGWKTDVTILNLFKL